MTATRVSRSEQHARTRAGLLEAASRVFARRGLERASIDEIAAEAGYTKGAFYASFASKEELFLELVDAKFAGAVERLREILGDGEEPQRQARDAAIDFTRNVHSDPDWSRLFFEFTVRAAREPAFREHLAERYEVLREQLAEVYRDWSAGFPAPPPLPFEQIATMTYCMANGFLAEQLIEPDLDDEIYGSMLEVFFRGLQAMAEDRAASG